MFPSTWCKIIIYDDNNNKISLETCLKIFKLVIRGKDKLSKQ